MIFSRKIRLDISCKLEKNKKKHFEMLSCEIFTQHAIKGLIGDMCNDSWREFIVLLIPWRFLPFLH